MITAVIYPGTWVPRYLGIHIITVAYQVLVGYDQKINLADDEDAFAKTVESYILKSSDLISTNLV